MKKLIAICVVAGLMLAVSGTAQAVPYISTFDITQADFSLTGFSWDHDGIPATPRMPTTGPNWLDINNVSGTYHLDIPPAGDFLWYVYTSGSASADFNKDNIWDETLTLDNVFLGNFASPGPSTSWGPGSIPFTFTTFDFTLGYHVNLDGDYPIDNFGPHAFANFTLSDDPAGMFLGNAFLTVQDNLYGGGDGIIDGWTKGHLAVTAIPEPATMILLGMGLLAGVAGLKKKKA